jgi:hypothetical protein
LVTHRGRGRQPGGAVPPDLGTFRVATFAQSFHWIDTAVLVAPLGADPPIQAVLANAANVRDL